MSDKLLGIMTDIGVHVPKEGLPKDSDLRTQVVMPRVSIPVDLMC